MNNNVISASKIRSGDLLETLRFLYNADPASFKLAFANLGILINDESDLVVLSSMKDQFANGVLFGPNKKLVKFDLWSVMNSIPVDNYYLTHKSKIKMVA